MYGKLKLCATLPVGDCAIKNIDDKSAPGFFSQGFPAPN
jgi:hypothetical protein